MALMANMFKVKMYFLGLNIYTKNFAVDVKVILAGLLRYYPLQFYPSGFIRINPP